MIIAVINKFVDQVINASIEVFLLNIKDGTHFHYWLVFSIIYSSIKVFYKDKYDTKINMWAIRHSQQ